MVSRECSISKAFPYIPQSRLSRCVFFHDTLVNTSPCCWVVGWVLEVELMRNHYDLTPGLSVCKKVQFLQGHRFFNRNKESARTGSTRIWNWNEHWASSRKDPPPSKKSLRLIMSAKLNLGQETKPPTHIPRKGWPLQLYTPQWLTADYALWS
jgi:hypothetical protein